MGARVCGEEVASPPKGAETSLAPPKTLPCLLCKVSPHLFIHTIHLDLNHKSVASLSLPTSKGLNYSLVVLYIEALVDIISVCMDTGRGIMLLIL
jgi:hypothetical protein